MAKPKTALRGSPTGGRLPSGADGQAVQASQVKSIVRAEITRTAFSGPLPPPQILADYEAVTPGLADRLVAMAERNQDQRHGLENRVIDSQIRLASTGQFIAGAIAIVGLLVAGAVGIWGNPLVGFAIAGSDLATMAGLFLYNSHATKNERLQKARIMAGLAE